MACLTPLLLLSHVIPLVSVLQPPTNLKLVSENFQHILTWDDPNNESLIYYKVVCQRVGSPVVQSKSCSNITSRRCDLTKDFTDVLSTYTATVYSFTHQERSGEVATKGFNPLTQTLLGPPLVHVAPCVHCIEVSIQHPVSHLWSETEQRNISMHAGDVYPHMDYTIHIRHSAEGEHIIETSNISNATIIPQLLPNTNYCVSVDVKADLNVEHSIPSAPKCVMTEGSTTYTPWKMEVIVPVVCGLLLFLGLLLCLFALDRAGYIGMQRKFFPKVLKSLPQSNSRYSENNASPPPGYIVPVEIVSQKLKVEENQDSEDKYKEGDYATRKKLLDSDTSGGDSSGAVLSSLESSGQMTGSSGEERIPIGLGIIKESDVSILPIPVSDLELSAELPFNNSGVFNINLNSICRGNPMDTRTGPDSGGSLKDPETEADMDSAQAGPSVNGDIFVLAPSVFVNMEPTAVTYDSDDEEELSDQEDNCDADDHIGSGYMRR